MLNKTKTLLTTLLVFFITTGIMAQDSTLAKIPDPEFPNEPMLLVDSNYSLTAIPMERAEIEQKNKMSKTEAFYVLKTPHAKLHLASGRTYHIVVTHSPTSSLSSANPKDTYKLYKMAVDDKRGTRTCPFVTFEYKGFANNTTTKQPDTVPVTFKKVRNNTYLIIIENLIPGEYAISTGLKFFSFNID